MCVRLDPACPRCVQGRYDHLETPPDPPSFCAVGAVQIVPETKGVDLDLPELCSRPQAHGRFEVVSGRLRGVLDASGSTDAELELIVFEDGRAILSGTTDLDRARTIYDRYVGH